MQDDATWDVLSQFIRPLSPIRLEENKEELSEQLDRLDSDDRSVAVFGCGDGEFVEYLAEGHQNADVVGLEYSDVLAEEAVEKTENWSNAKIHTGDGLEYLDQRPDSFDSIYAINSVQETEKPAETTSQVFYDSLKEGGILNTTFPGDTDALPTTEEDGYPVLTIPVTSEVLEEVFGDQYDIPNDVNKELKQRYLPDSGVKAAFPNDKYSIIKKDTMDVDSENMEDIQNILNAAGMYSKAESTSKPEVEYIVARKI